MCLRTLKTGQSVSSNPGRLKSRYTAPQGSEGMIKEADDLLGCFSSLEISFSGLWV